MHYLGAAETYKRPLEALHDSVSHALQPPKPTITACDTDNTAISVKKITSYFTRVVCNIPVFQGNASSLKQVLHFYSVLYVRKVQFTNCLCMTHENFMY
jgi:hypothetical protein